MVLVFEGVGIDQRDIIERCDRHSGHRRHVAVDLDTDDGPGLFCHERRHAARAGTDFEDDIMFRQFRTGDDELEDVQIDEKILPEIAARMQPDLLEQAHQMRTGLTLGFGHVVGNGE